MKQAARAKTDEAKLPWWRRHVTLVVFIFLLITPLLYVEITSRLAYNEVSAESNRLRQALHGEERTLPPKGVNGFATTYSKGDGAISALECWPSLHCPFVEKSMLVAIEEGKETDFVNNTLQLFDYPKNESGSCRPFDQESSMCLASVHGKFWLTLTINVADPYHHGAPESNDDIKPKVWRAVTFRVEQNP